MIYLVFGTGKAGLGNSIKIVGQVALNASLRGDKRVVIWALALHQDIVIDKGGRTRLALEGGSIIELVVGANGTILSIKVWVSGWAIVALFAGDVVDLLERACFADSLAIGPILRVLALHAHFPIPVQTFGFVASAHLEFLHVGPACRAVLALSVI